MRLPREKLEHLSTLLGLTSAAQTQKSNLLIFTENLINSSTQEEPIEVPWSYLLPLISRPITSSWTIRDATDQTKQIAQ